MAIQNKNVNRKRSNPIKPKKFDKKFIVFISLFAIIIIIIGLFLTFALNFNNHNNENNNNIINGKNPVISIQTNKGNILVELYEDKVPNTVQNFLDYVNDKFYDGLVFHRVIDDFVIQAGGYYPDGTFKTPSRNPIELEINKDLRHVDGAIAMARTSNPNSATTQFYICDGAQSSLDDNYAVFGEVISGIETVRDIALSNTTSKYGMADWPEKNIIINTILIFKEI